MSKKIICLMGPTAAGKTDLACALAQQLPCEMISVDSAMIYQGMNIGTAKPCHDTLLKFPHDLIDICSPLESYSAAQFCDDTHKLCEEIFKRGNFPLLVGGSMMYFNALQQGLSTLPRTDPLIRKDLLKLNEERGLSYLYQQLKHCDAVTAAKLHEHDTQRIHRALEVYYMTGKKLSFLIQDERESSPYRFLNIILFPENRQWLHERIALRFDEMISMGLIEEVEDLLQRWPLNSDYPSMRCVGYRQVLTYLHEGYPKALLREQGIAATRQLAKRQLTWLRRWPEGHWFAPESMDPDTLLAEVMRLI